jgi:HAD superfamily hydrolase (TIGR01549 family)
MRWKVVILDFDGVVIESVGIKDWAFETLFKDHAEHLGQIMSYHLAHNAVIRFEKFRYIYENILKKPYSDEIQQQLSQKFSELVFKKIVECPYVEGAKDFLEFFSKKTSLYLVSMSPGKELQDILKSRGLDQYFKRVYAADWLKKDAILDILKHENATTAETVFIGDSFEDYQSTKQAGANFVGRYSYKSFGNIDIPIFSTMGEIKDFLTHA